MKSKFVTRVALVVLALTAIMISVVTMTPRWTAAEESVVTTEEIDDRQVVDESEWDFEAAVERARAEEEALRKAPRALAESNTIEQEMYDAALKLQPSLKRNSRQARRVVGVLFEAAVEHDVNPFLVLAYASRESGLRANVRGAIGEEGLLQLHGYARRICGKGRDMGQPRANADAGLCYYQHLRDICDSDDHWVLVAAYGTGKCLSPESARKLACGQRKRAELVKAVGEKRAEEIWPEGG